MAIKVTFSDGLNWRTVENTVIKKTVNRSLLHTLQSTKKIKRRTRALNIKLNRRTLRKSYRWYVKTKTRILRNLTDNEDTDDDGNPYNIGIEPSDDNSSLASQCSLQGRDLSIDSSYSDSAIDTDSENLPKKRKSLKRKNSTVGSDSSERLAKRRNLCTNKKASEAVSVDHDQTQGNVLKNVKRNLISSLKDSKKDSVIIGDSIKIDKRNSHEFRRNAELRDSVQIGNFSDEPTCENTESVTDQISVSSDTESNGKRMTRSTRASLNSEKKIKGKGPVGSLNTDSSNDSDCGKLSRKLRSQTKKNKTPGSHSSTQLANSSLQENTNVPEAYSVNRVSTSDAGLINVRRNLTSFLEDPKDKSGIINENIETDKRDSHEFRGNTELQDSVLSQHVHNNKTTVEKTEFVSGKISLNSDDESHDKQMMKSPRVGAKLEEKATEEAVNEKQEEKTLKEEKKVGEVHEEEETENEEEEKEEVTENYEEQEKEEVTEIKEEEKEEVTEIEEEEKEEVTKIEEEEEKEEVTEIEEEEKEEVTEIEEEEKEEVIEKDEEKVKEEETEIEEEETEKEEEGTEKEEENEDETEKEEESVAAATVADEEQQQKRLNFESPMKKSQPVIMSTEIVKAKYTIVRDEDETTDLDDSAHIECSSHKASRSPRGNTFLNDQEASQLRELSPDKNGVVQRKSINLVVSKSSDSEDTRDSQDNRVDFNNRVDDVDSSDSNRIEEFEDSPPPSCSQIISDPSNSDESIVQPDDRNHHTLISKSIRSQIREQENFYSSTPLNNTSNFKKTSSVKLMTHDALEERKFEKVLENVSEIDNLTVSRYGKEEDEQVLGNDLRPIELCEFVNREGLVATEELSTITAKDFKEFAGENSEEEIWLMEIPKSIITDGDELCGKTMSFENGKMRINGTTYRTKRRDEKSVTCILRSRKKKSRFKTVNVEAVGCIVVRQEFPNATTPPPPVQSANEFRSIVPFPENLKSRNPLLGLNSSDGMDHLEHGSIEKNTPETLQSKKKRKKKSKDLEYQQIC